MDVYDVRSDGHVDRGREGKAARREQQARLGVRKLGFPVAADASNVMLRGDARAPDREKGQRRRLIDRDYRVVLMLGDNLGDFLDGINADVATRQALMAPYADWWGVRWFMLDEAVEASTEEWMRARVYEKLNRKVRALG